jgi:AraC-like DNA-binding protein
LHEIDTFDQMKYHEFSPSDALKPYVKCFYSIEHEFDVVVNDRAFAMGCVEFMFNLSDGAFETGRGSSYSKTPKAELWGQIIRPLNYRSLGKNKLLGVRFFPHTASLFLKEPISMFNDGVSDVQSVLGKDAEELHQKLWHSPELNSQILLLEAFLTKRLIRFEKKQNKFRLVNDAMTEMKRADFFDNIENVAFRYGISSRYLQKLFLDYTGLTPKLYQKITRFQKSLFLTGTRYESLTSVAHACGYFDQSHFIRDFKFFTDTTPSAFDPKSSSAVLLAGK